MTRIYRYVLKNDTGMAPNPRDGRISLATCKPEIRRMAEEGDWVLGCFPSQRNELIAWAGRIEHSMPIALYSQKYPDRADALYEYGADGELTRIDGKHPWYHQTPDEQRKDKKGNVLVFAKDSSWYFGEDGRELPPQLKHLAAYGQGHRVNGRMANDLQFLKQWLSKQGRPGTHGTPRDGWAGPDRPPCGPPRPRNKSRPRC